MENKIYVFDLGNVIVVPMNTHLLYEKLGCKISYEEFLEFFKNDKSVIDAHAGLISDDEHIAKLLQFSGSLISIQEYREIFCGPIRNSLYEDTVEIIDELKRNGNRVCLLSNLRKIDFDWFCSVYDISKFDDLFLSYEMHINKPDLRIYEEMINHLKSNPKDIYFFDDSKSNVEAAQKCGINAFLVTGNTIKEIFDKNIRKDEIYR